MKKWKILARHKKWVSGAIITESIDNSKQTPNKTYRRFTATIRGFQSWLIYEGYLQFNTVQQVIKKVKSIKDRIDNGDESVFY